ncbi:antennal esterase precursor [Bombyx mori]|uniref:Antennal esterase n=1 Tax=Bombyx mori TaxID=7091 RepID=D9ILE0_BOMMO|nr:antennal esterase precursor [Bombyx mori]ADI47117.1 antennal esterase [Bombyx mori]
MHLAFFLLLFNYVRCFEYVELKTRIGVVRGHRNNYGAEFLGIPYAKVDDGRPFGNSLPYPYFEAPFEASNPSTRCPQVGRVIGGTQQCLTLNIYVPENANATQTVPVFVWFHGGGFKIGSAGEYGGKHLTQHGIIVVTVNYRLGPYGFLCLDEEVPGNQGLKDQVTALKWVQANIGDFGGDKSKVTIGGQSYGGGAVDLHMYSSDVKLFDKVIIQSGSMYAEGAFVKSDLNAAIKLSGQLGCSTNNTKDALKCLATRDSLTVVKAAKDIGLKLGACKEKTMNGSENFITQDPFHLDFVKRDDIAVLIGHNSNENFARFANQSEEFYERLANVFREKFVNNFVLSENDLDQLSNNTQAFYLGKNGSLTAKELKEFNVQLSDFSSDFMLNYPVEWSIKNYLRKGLKKIYKYVFSYTGGSPFKDVPGVGAYHTEELQYLFETEQQGNSDEQQLLRKRMTSMWANFVKFGNPTPSRTDLLPVAWVPVTESTQPYLNIDVEMKMLDNLFESRMKYWADFWSQHWMKNIILS